MPFLGGVKVLGEIAAEHDSTIIFPASLLETAKAVTAFVHGEGDGARPEARAA